MTDKALAIYQQFDQLEKAAKALQASGYFKDVTTQAQAIVKVMAGAELGLPPFASMTGIHIIQGKPVLGANVIATLVKNDPRYNYRVKEASDTTCTIEWLEDGKPAGTSSFTMAEAKTAGLTGKDNWAKYPSDMLFARAISRGARRFAPGIFGGSPIYTPDEMDADVDEDGNVVIDTTAIDITPPAPLEVPYYKLVEYPPELKLITNSKGEPYPDIDDMRLVYMQKALIKNIENPDTSDDEMATLSAKVQAINEIQKLREQYKFHE